MAAAQKNAPSPAPDSEGFRIVSASDALGIAEIGSLCLVRWRGEVNQKRFERQHDALASVVARFPKRAGMVCVIETGCPLPPDKLRKASIDMISNHGERLRCVVCVIEGAGFRAAATRGALSGMALLLRNRQTDVRFTATVDDAAPLVARTCQDVTIGAVCRAHDQLRRMLDRGDVGSSQ